MPNNNIQTGYGVGQYLQVIFPAPVVAQRAPTTRDINYPLGQGWVNVPANAYYVLSSVVNNSANWINVSGAAGVFTSLTVNPGPTNLSTVGNGAVNIGNAANTQAVTLTSGVGNLSIVGAGHSITIGQDAAANQVFLGSVTNGALTTISGGNTAVDAIQLQTAPAGGIQIGINTQTGSITVGNSTAGNNVFINSGVNAGPQEVHIADGATGANSLVSILSGAGTAGAGSLLMADNTRVTTVDLGNVAPAAARTTTIAGGNSAQNDTVNILNGAPSANTQTFNLMCGTATGGTQAVNIANGVGGALTLSMANGVNTTAQVVNLASGASGANNTVNILNGTSTAGVQTVNIAGAGNTRASLVNIGTGNAAHDVTIGNANVGSACVINSGLSTTINSGILQINSGNVLNNTINVYTGAGAPGNGLAVHTGDLYVNTTAATAATRLYIATGAGAWTNFTAAA